MGKVAGRSHYGRVELNEQGQLRDYGGKATMTASLGTQTSVRSSRFDEEVGQQLLPGIPNEVTLDHITSKLPWRAIHNLRIVSHSWQQAIRQVYHARVRLKSTETLVVLNHEDEQQNWIGIYSIRDKLLSFLPPIPHVDVGIPMLCQCVSLDGKIYILGGITSLAFLNTGLLDPGSQKVYVLDLVRQRQWKQCSSMQESRVRFGCRVLNGKIYVFGGVCKRKPVRVSEVYDPKTNAWSPIMPMMSYGRWGHQVEAVEEELYVHDGLFLDWDPSVSTGDQDIDFDRVTRNPLFLEIYHPIRNEWRKVDLFKRCSDEVMFVARGKFYSMSELGISVHDSTTLSWTHLHSCSFEALGPVHSVRVCPSDVLAVDDELLARVYWISGDAGTVGECLLQSRGFGRGNERILWDKVGDVGQSRQFPGFMSPVRL